LLKCFLADKAASTHRTIGEMRETAVEGSVTFRSNCACFPERSL